MQAFTGNHRWQNLQSLWRWQSLKDGLHIAFTINSINYFLLLFVNVSPTIVSVTPRTSRSRRGSLKISRILGNRCQNIGGRHRRMNRTATRLGRPMLGLKPDSTAGKKLRQRKHDQTADTADHTKYSAVNDAFKCFWYWVEVVEEQS